MVPFAVTIAVAIALWLEISTKDAADYGVFILAMLWLASRLQNRVATLAISAIVFFAYGVLTISSETLGAISNADYFLVLSAAAIVFWGARHEAESVLPSNTYQVLDIDLPSDADDDDGDGTISVDEDRAILAKLRVADLAGIELVERMKQSRAFLPKQISRVQDFASKRSMSALSMDRLVSAGLLTEFQAVHLHWGREDQLRFDKYSLVEMIGRGGMSTVFRALNMERGETIALKLMAANEKSIPRAEREIEIAKQLAHKNIVVAYDAGRVHSRFYIEMEYVSGSDLNHIIRRNGPLSQRQALTYALQIARGLQYAHSKGLVHRDVKPGNLLVTADSVVKITDLGLAHNLRTDSLTKERQANPHHLIGTIEYMSPEQAFNSQEVDERSDIYSLGATLFYLLTGKTRVTGKTIGQKITNLVSKHQFRDAVHLGVRSEVAELLRDLCKHQPDQRLQSMNEVIERIEALLGENNAHDAGIIRVLIVEDNQDDMYAARRILKRINRSLQTTEATTLTACCEVMNQSVSDAKIDLVLLDLNLPDSIGFQTIVRFRQLYPDTPLVVVTGLSDPEYGSKCIEIGANDFLPKCDANAESLERSIFMTLARYRVQLEERQRENSGHPIARKPKQN